MTSYKYISTDDLVNYTIDYLGKPIKSKFNKLYRTNPAKIPNNAGYTSLFLDPLGDEGLLDLQEINTTNEPSYSIQPDVWIGETALFNTSDYNHEAVQDIKENFGIRKLHFVVLRRVGDPSINYMIKEQYDNVFLVERSAVIKYNEILCETYGYQTLERELISQRYVNNNIFDFNILKF